MKSYEEIKKEELLLTKNYSDKKLNRYIKVCKILKWFLNEKFLWILSIIPFSIIPGFFTLLGVFSLNTFTILIFLFGHLIYWNILGSKEANKLIDDSVPELELGIKVLEDIKEMRNNE